MIMVGPRRPTAGAQWRQHAKGPLPEHGARAPRHSPYEKTNAAIEQIQGRARELDRVVAVFTLAAPVPSMMSLRCLDL